MVVEFLKKKKGVRRVTDNLTLIKTVYLFFHFYFYIVSPDFDWCKFGNSIYLLLTRSNVFLSFTDIDNSYFDP